MSLRAEEMLGGPRWPSAAEVTFSDIARNVSAAVTPAEALQLDRAVGLEHLEPGVPRVSSWTSAAETGFTRRFRAGQVLFGKRRAYQRKAAVAEFDGVCSGDILVFEGRAERLLPELLIYVVRSDAFVDHALGTSAGSMSPRTKWSDMARFPLVVPSEPSEQEALARVLRAATEKVLTTRSAAAAATVARQALLASYFADEGPLPAGWMETTLGQHFQCQSGATPRRSEHERYFVGGDIPWVKTLDLNQGTVLDTEEHITQAAIAETSCRLNAVGTVMVAMYGGFNQIGRTAMLGVEAASNQAVCCLSPKPNGELIPKLALYALQGNRRRWRRVAASSRKDPNITKGDVEKFSVRAPSDPARQMEMCERVETVDRLIEELGQAIAGAERVEQALINQFVAGEL